MLALAMGIVVVALDGEAIWNGFCVVGFNLFRLFGGQLNKDHLLISSALNNNQATDFVA